MIGLRTQQRRVQLPNLLYLSARVRHKPLGQIEVGVVGQTDHAEGQFRQQTSAGDRLADGDAVAQDEFSRRLRHDCEQRSLSAPAGQQVSRTTTRSFPLDRLWIVVEHQAKGFQIFDLVRPDAHADAPVVGPGAAQGFQREDCLRVDLLGDRPALACDAFAEVVNEDEEVVEVDRAAAVQVVERQLAGGFLAEGVDEEEEVVKGDCAVAVEIAGQFRRFLGGEILGSGEIAQE